MSARYLLNASAAAVTALLAAMVLARVLTIGHAHRSMV
ncbi:hypothetical protein BJ956_002947 [Arthrobacter psychrochitiniphilus]|nr:hypothetical protein [Arthrobacter psychrochitiniphilus]